MMAWLSVVTANAAPNDEPVRSSNTVDVPPPAHRLDSVIDAVSIVHDGDSVGVVSCFDRLDSGYGTLRFDWDGPGDLCALSNGVMSASGSSIHLDLLSDFDRVLIMPATRTSTALRPSTLRITAARSTVSFRLPAVTCFGLWPRLSLYRVDQHVYLVVESGLDSFTLDEAAARFDFSPTSFVIAQST